MLGVSLSNRLDEIFSRNQITPSVARDEILEVTSQVEQLSEGLSQLLAGFSFFEIGSESLEPGEAEVSVLIPRPAVGEDLKQLGDQFSQLERILGPFLELGDGSRPPIKVKTIASSDFAIYLAMLPGAAAVLANALDRILGSYQKILEIKKLRQEMSNQGMPDESLASVDSWASSRMMDDIDAASSEIVEATPGLDKGRAEELKTELRRSMRELAMRIDVGFNIDVRAEPPDPAEEEDGQESSSDGSDSSLLRQQVQVIIDVSPRLKFINPSGRPILSLGDGTQIEHDRDH